MKPRFEWINRDLLYRQKISMDGMQKQEEINVLLNVGHIQLAIRLLQSETISNQDSKGILNLVQ